MACALHTQPLPQLLPQPRVSLPLSDPLPPVISRQVSSGGEPALCRTGYGGSLGRAADGGCGYGRLELGLAVAGGTLGVLGKWGPLSAWQLVFPGPGGACRSPASLPHPQQSGNRAENLPRPLPPRAPPRSHIPTCCSDSHPGSAPGPFSVLRVQLTCPGPPPHRTREPNSRQGEAALWWRKCCSSPGYTAPSLGAWATECHRAGS